eukprot:m.205937 g.205937  ORF g.205937 m.205937 type:complete len:598 (+) comp22029_c0_seq5:2577-4370(+)
MMACAGGHSSRGACNSISSSNILTSNSPVLRMHSSTIFMGLELAFLAMAITKTLTGSSMCTCTLRWGSVCAGPAAAFPAPSPCVSRALILAMSLAVGSDMRRSEADSGGVGSPLATPCAWVAEEGSVPTLHRRDSALELDWVLTGSGVRLRCGSGEAGVLSIARSEPRSIGTEKKNRKEKTLPMHYRCFFAPAACQVCFQTQDTAAILRCSGCKCVAYCSKEHQKDDWARHKNACKFMQQCRNGALANDFTTSVQSALEWDKRAQRLVTALEITAEARRFDVHPCDRDMILFMRHCECCFHQTAADLVECPSCLMASFCRTHTQQEIDAKHKSDCNDFLLHLRMIRFHLKGDSQITPLPSTPPPCDLATLTADGWNKYIPLRYPGDVVADTARVCAAQTALTLPLTVLHALKVLSHQPVDKIPQLQVVVLGAADFEGANIVAFGELLLLLPALQRLEMHLVGPEASLPEGVDLPENLSVFCHCCRFDEFFGSGKMPEISLVCGFNSGIHEHYEDKQMYTWSMTLELLIKGEYPCIFTAYNSQEIEMDWIVLKSLGARNLAKPTRNPWRATHPLLERSLLSDNRFFFINNFFVTFGKS